MLQVRTSKRPGVVWYGNDRADPLDEMTAADGCLPLVHERTPGCPVYDGTHSGAFFRLLGSAVQHVLNDFGEVARQPWLSGQ